MESVSEIDEDDCLAATRGATACRGQRGSYPWDLSERGQMICTWGHRYINSFLEATQHLNDRFVKLSGTT